MYKRRRSEIIMIDGENQWSIMRSSPFYSYVSNIITLDKKIKELSLKASSDEEINTLKELSALLDGLITSRGHIVLGGAETAVYTYSGGRDFLDKITASDAYIINQVEQLVKRYDEENDLMHQNREEEIKNATYDLFSYDLLSRDEMRNIIVFEKGVRSRELTADFLNRVDRETDEYVSRTLGITENSPYYRYLTVQEKTRRVLEDVVKLARETDKAGSEIYRSSTINYLETLLARNDDLYTDRTDMYRRLKYDRKTGYSNLMKDKKGEPFVDKIADVDGQILYGAESLRMLLCNRIRNDQEISISDYESIIKNCEEMLDKTSRVRKFDEAVIEATLKGIDKQRRYELTERGTIRELATRKEMLKKVGKRVAVGVTIAGLAVGGAKVCDNLFNSPKVNDAPSAIYTVIDPDHSQIVEASNEKNILNGQNSQDVSTVQEDTATVVQEETTPGQEISTKQETGSTKETKNDPRSENVVSAMSPREIKKIADAVRMGDKKVPSAVYGVSLISNPSMTDNEIVMEFFNRYYACVDSMKGSESIQILPIFYQLPEVLDELVCYDASILDGRASSNKFNIYYKRDDNGNPVQKVTLQKSTNSKSVYIVDNYEENSKSARGQAAIAACSFHRYVGDNGRNQKATVAWAEVDVNYNVRYSFEKLSSYFDTFLQEISNHEVARNSQEIGE